MKTLIAIAALTATSLAQANVGIASGNKTGTNWPMVQDIVSVCSKPNNVITNVLSDGSIENITKIYTDKSTQFGVVQEDALVLMKAQDPKMMERVVAVFPFFSVEMHLVVNANSQIKSLSDLTGKRVAMGPEGSGTIVSTQVIQSLSNIKWVKDENNLTQAQAIAALQNNSIDAAFIVAGQPISVLKNATNIKLIPVQHPKLDEFSYYTKTMLPSKTYPWQTNSVQTYKVNNVLATFAFKNQFQREIGELVTCITKNMDTLQTNPQHHPKWRSVDPLDINLVKWPTHPAAVSAIKRATK